MEDELVSNLVVTELETVDEKGPDPKRLHINLEGILKHYDRFLGRRDYELRTRAMDDASKSSKLTERHSRHGLIHQPDSIVEEKQSEAELKMQETQEEIQRVRDMLLKITGKDKREEKKELFPKFASEKEFHEDRGHQARISTRDNNLKNGDSRVEHKERERTREKEKEDRKKSHKDKDSRYSYAYT